MRPQSESDAIIHRMIAEMVGADEIGEVSVTGTGSLESVFPVTELATAAIAAAGIATRDYLVATGQASTPVVVDRRLASLWFGSSVRPQGWQLPPLWDAVAGDYRTRDGWIRLHTNAPHHRAAALAVLGVPADRDAVTAAVQRWAGSELESAVVGAGGCAAVMQTAAQWQASAPGRSVAAEPLIRWQRCGVSAVAAEVPIDRARPLAGVRVLDLTRVLAGPIATRFLAQLGATVLRIDPPEWDEPGVLPDVMLGKRSARLDLRAATGRERLLRLLVGADILVHGYRPGALDSVNLGRGVREGANPGLIEVSLDAYGWSGPWAGRRGFDSLVQMSTGIADAGMRRFGRDTPTPLPVQALDHATGYLMAHAAIRALGERKHTGRGSRAMLSLARTARLLIGGGAGEPGEPIEPENEHDLAAGVEQTSWGTARRLRPPLSIAGVELRADIPARELGGDAACW